MSFKIAGVLLAAGLSRRAGPVNKLLVPIDGIAMGRRCLACMLESGCAPIVVVTGHEAARVEAELAVDGAEFVYNKAFADGMGSSVQAGVAALPADVDAVIIGLADMPHVQPQTYARLRDAYAPEAGQHICVPSFQGKPGNPVLFGRRFFKALLQCAGDKGGRLIVAENPDCVVEVPVSDPGIHMDHDTVQGLT